MAITDLPMLSMLRTKMQWQQERQRVLAENVSNSDTPNIRPRDLVEPTFDKTGIKGMHEIAMVRTIAISCMPLMPVLSNVGSTRSRGRIFGVSELETFSARTRCRS